MDRYIETQAIKELTLHNPLTEEKWDLINDWEFDRSDRVTFLTPQGKKVEFAKVVRCKDCRHRPYPTEPGKTYGLTIKAPDDMCPCYNGDDGWYSWIPDNEFFCSYGERKEIKE